jgi:hypothetical protein
MVMATFGDLIIMAVIIFLLPLMKIKWHEIIKLEILATAAALAVELYATKTQRWFYTNSNILLPWIGVSIFPLLQMIIIAPLSFKFAIFCSEKT